MKVVTFAAIKGGVGKTTLAFNFGEYLAYKKSKKVLFVDLDHQCNLTQTYEIYDSETTIGNIFEQQGDVKIHNISNNVSLIAGNMHLDSIERKIENQTNKNMLMYMWLADKYDKLGLDKFDYIVLDTHPDFSVATKNALAISHAIFSPITPSKDGYNARFNIKERLDEYRKEAIDFQTRKSYITAKLDFIANMVKNNTHSSKELLKSIKDDDSVIAVIPNKEAFNQSTIAEMSIAKATTLEKDQGKNDDQNKLIAKLKRGDQLKFLDNTFKTFDKMQQEIDSRK